MGIVTQKTWADSRSLYLIARSLEKGKACQRSLQQCASCNVTALVRLPNSFTTKMSAPPAQVATSAFWRASGMTYVKYSNLCAEVVRACLKEPAFTTAKARNTVYFKHV